MFKLGIRNRLIFSYLTLVLVTLLLLGSYFLWYFYRHNLQSLTGVLRNQAYIVEEMLEYKAASPQDKAAIDPVIKDLATKINSRITVIDPDGTVVADSWETPAQMENHATRSEVVAALANGYGVSVRYSTTENENLLYVAIPVEHNGAIVGVARVSTTLAHVEKGYKEVRSALFAAFLLASLLAIIISFRLARKYTAPLEEITTTARQIAEGDLGRRVYLHTGDELEVLANTLNHLAANLDDTLNEIIAEKSKLEVILQHTNSAVMLLDKYRQVVKINLAAAEVFSITPPMIGSHNLKVIGSSHFDKAVQEAMDSRQKKMIDLKTDLQNDKRIFQVFLAPITGGDTYANSVLAVFHDITALREVQEKQAEFVANASHELATPLTAIKGFAETLLDGALSDPETASHFVEIILSEAERMNRLINDLLQLAKLDSNDYRKSVHIAATPVEPVVAATVNELSPNWQNKNLTVTVNPPSLPLATVANPDWLKQILLNLLDNAVKYTPPEGRIEVEWYQEIDKVAFKVADSGPGIAPQELPRIFDRFYRVDKARTRSAGGTGLGLAIVKFFVELLGGEIEAKSVVGEGTTIIFRLPLAK